MDLIVNNQMQTELLGNLHTWADTMAAGMALEHPLDQGLRDKVKALQPNQAEFAKAIGRSQGWLNKYMNGVGNATIDDAVRIAALLVGVEAQPVGARERRLLKAWRQIPEERQDDAVAVLENVARGYRPGRRQGSGARVARTPAETKSTTRGKQSAGG